MGSNRQGQIRPLLVTLEFIELQEAQTRLAQAFRLVLAQSPTQKPSHVTGACQEETETEKQEFEADL